MYSNEFQEILLFIREEKFPEAVQASRQRKWNYKRKMSSYFLEDSNRLFKRVKVEGKDADVEVPLQSQLNDIYKKFHDEVGHPGINSTHNSILQRYTWAGISQDVREYVRTCNICQMTAALPPQPQKKLQPIPPPSKTWRHIGMDIICDLSASEDGYKHLLVTVCYLSKYVVVRPLKSKTSEEVIQNLKDIYLDMGLPDIIQHDQGKEFTSNKTDKNGESDRGSLVQTAQTCCTCYELHQENSLGQTPFKVMWGRESRHQDLLSTINNLVINEEEDFELEEAIFSEVLAPLDDIKEMTYFLHLLTIASKKLAVLMTLELLHNNQPWIVSI